MLLTLLGGCMVTSVGMSNVVWPLLLANWLLEGRWAEKWQRARRSRVLHVAVALFLLHVAGLLWTSDLGQGLHVVERELPLLAVSLVVLTSRPPAERQRKYILGIYAATVLVVSVIGLVRWLTVPGLPYRDIVPYISHIRFALNCCMVIYLAVGEVGRSGRAHPWWTAGLLLLVVWLLAFLLLLRSYTALAVLAVVSLVSIVCFHRRWWWLAAWLAVMTASAASIVMGCRSYYRLGPLSTEPLRAVTANGRPYIHLQDGLVENGNYVNNYICREELRSEWQRRSTVPYDTLLPDGYPLGATLVRYLNALGLTKDSAGVAAMTDAQRAEVASGVANPVHLHSSRLKSMLYTTLFEYESYRCYHATNGYSLLERLELWRTVLPIIGRHPLAGVGTGDLPQEMEAEMKAAGSPMTGCNMMPHNEYLTLAALFGLPLLVLVALLFLRALPALRRQRPLMTVWMVTVLISFLTENTLDSLAGILLCTWFMAFRQEHEGDC